MTKDCSRRDFIKILGAGAAAAFLPAGVSSAQKLFSSKSAEIGLKTRALVTDRPNIVFILADDLGYGDVSCLNSTCRVTTPNIDRMAAQGKIFNDSHTTSGVCSPTRYGIMTGRYNWRSRLQSGVLQGYSLPLIEAGRKTVASYLKENGYTTACIGKWHLGLGWALKPAYTFNDVYTYADSHGTDYMGNDGKYFDFTKPFADGPTTKGFDYYFGISASLDMPPYVYLENDKATSVPTVTTSAWGRTGLAAVGFDGHNVLGDLTRKAIWWIEQNKTRPFFLYMPLNAPHEPHMPSAAFVDKSVSDTFGGSTYYDYVLEVDWAVGQIMDTLDNNGLGNKTVMMFTSDNGPEDRTENGGQNGTAYPLRGRKRDLWDGGHRTPYIARWPGKIAPGTTSTQIICTVDLFATCSNIIGSPIIPPDSMNILPAFLGTDHGVPIREATVHHSSRGFFAIRKGNWKYLDHKNSGGNIYGSGPNMELTTDPPKQLYDMNADITENRDSNQYLSNPGGKVEELTTILNRYKSQGHSQPNGIVPDFL